MRRWLAILLPVLLSFPLIAPALYADAGRELPACCRRDGKHHCTLGAQGDGVQAASARCALYPSAGVAAHEPGAAALPGTNAIAVAWLLGGPAAELLTGHAASAPPARAHQKRGPPPLS